MLTRLTAVALCAGDAQGATQAAARARMAAPSPRGAMRAGDEERGRAVRRPVHPRMPLTRMWHTRLLVRHTLVRVSA